MTCRQLYLEARRRLSQAGIDSPGVDAALLSQRFLGLDRPGLALHGEEEPAPEQAAAFLQAVEERAARRPLQYILGEWEFLGLPLAVGEGVLCPREDTAVLVESLAQGLQGRPAPRGLDLCAGTGAVALGLLTFLPGAVVQCVELSDKAFPYLEENLRRHGRGQVTARKGDVLSPALAGEFAPGSLDFVASNPPYIETGELATLQPEVRREPALALDGGGDGLVLPGHRPAVGAPGKARGPGGRGDWRNPRPGRGGTFSTAWPGGCGNPAGLGRAGPGRPRQTAVTSRAVSWIAGAFSPA